MDEATKEKPKQVLPIRSRRIAAQALSRVPTSKRSELLVMKRLGFLDGQPRPSSTVMKDYDSIIIEELQSITRRSHERALSRTWQWRAVETARQ
jgi:hypothetical protein